MEKRWNHKGAIGFTDWACYANFEVDINYCQNENKMKNQDKLSIGNNTDELTSLIYKEFT